MWALQALAIMLSIQAGTPDLVGTPSEVGTLPPAVPTVQTLPIKLPSASGLKDDSKPQGSPPKRHPAAPIGGKCTPTASYFLSSDKLQEYLMGSLPPQIEDIVKCDEVNMGGLLGKVLTTVNEADLLSLLNANSLLQGGGALDLPGPLGKGDNEDSSKSSSGPKAIGGLTDMLLGGPLGSLTKSGGGKDTGDGLLNKKVLSKVKASLDEEVEHVNSIRDSVLEEVKNVVPEQITDPLSDVLQTKTKDLLINLKVDKVTEESTDIAMEDDEIQVHSTLTATIGADGLAGTVIQTLQFQSQVEVTMRIATSSNNTQCVTLDVQDTHIQVNTMDIKLLKTVTDTVSLPVSLPLNDLIPVLLTAEMNENLEKSNSCAIDLGDFNDCKNTTGLFKYQVQSSMINPKGLTILYCAEANFSKNSVPVPAGRLPQAPKNASIALTISSSMLKTLVKHVAKNSSVQMSDLSTKITYVGLASQKDNLLKVQYKVNITKDGEHFATGKTQLYISHSSKISDSKLEPNIKLTRSEHSVKPPEAKEEVEGIMSEVVKKSWANLKGLYADMNMPPVVSSFPIKDAPVQLLRSAKLSRCSQADALSPSLTHCYVIS
ncbi:vomeromodulin-like [Acomys russatus]|uniref:vomeromodulin-like n=1 Tax=Acomys russatus TaxID=60746 RepID=UPI0021E2560A|nr:vomeromodulin-like [Acomys russatus]